MTRDLSQGIKGGYDSTKSMHKGNNNSTLGEERKRRRGEEASMIIPLQD